MKNKIILGLLAAASSLLTSCMVPSGGNCGYGYGDSKGGMSVSCPPQGGSPVQFGLGVQLNNQQAMMGGGGYGQQRPCPPQGYGRPQGPPPPGYGRPQQRPPQYGGGYGQQRPCPPQYGGGYPPQYRQPAPGRPMPRGYGQQPRPSRNSVTVYGHTYSDANPSGYKPMR